MSEFYTSKVNGFALRVIARFDDMIAYHHIDGGIEVINQELLDDDIIVLSATHDNIGRLKAVELPWFTTTRHPYKMIPASVFLYGQWVNCRLCCAHGAIWSYDAFLRPIPKALLEEEASIPWSEREDIWERIWVHVYGEVAA